MSKINIIQHGIDGMGHQLHGLLSCLALHDINKYYFDGYVFINKYISFQHIKGKELLNVKKYLLEIVKKFIKYNNQTKKKYKNHIHSHEVYNIPTKYDKYTIYSLDNAYYFNKIPINKIEYNQYLMNIQNYKKFFINKKLPNNRLPKKNVVIHIRLGDAMAGRGTVINKHNKQLIRLMQPFTSKYYDHTFYIHSDGNVDFLTNVLSKKNINYITFNKTEYILNVFSDFIHSKIFITGHSSLSTVATFLGNHEVVIIPDDIKHSVPENTIRISEYKK